MLFLEGSDVGRGKTMDCLVYQNKDVKEDPLMYRESVDVYNVRGDMVMFVRPSDQLGSCILDGHLEMSQSSQHAAAVVKTR